jgi:hypothetical protein
MEPTTAELELMKLAVDAFRWAQLKDEAVTALLSALGIETDDHVRVLAAVSAGDWESVLNDWKAAPALKAKAAIAWGAAKRASGVVSTSVGSGGTAVVPAAIGGLSKFKLNTVVNQASDVELTALDGKSISVAYTNYRTAFGTDPPPDEELSVEQLTAVKTLVDNDLVPYVDFAIWGPHGGRLMRKLKLQGTTFSRDGTLLPIEVVGPPNFDTWLASYMCLRTALISWKVVDLGRLDAYSRLIGRYVERYGAGSWYQIYQAEVRCRSEHMERIRRRGEEGRAVALMAGHTHALDMMRPWDWVWGEAARDLEYWRVELEEPALLMLTRSRPSPASSSGAASAPVKRLALEDNGPSLKNARVRADMHNVEGNAFKTNRRGKRLCEDFNRGACSPGGKDDMCLKHPGLSHQCSRCLSSAHGLNVCNRTDYPALKAQKTSGKGGKGGKGGKNGKKGRWQY